MINLEPTIADSALGKFQLAADKDKHYFESPLFKGNIVLIILIYYQLIQNLQVKMKKQQKKMVLQTNN